MKRPVCLTCLHPNCLVLMQHGRSCCPRHWARLPDELRRRIAKSPSAEERGAARVEALEYFRSRMVGLHEITRCDGDDCGADIVWMITRMRRPIPVDVASVEATDHTFDPQRHICHFATCANAGQFRKKSAL